VATILVLSLWTNAELSRLLTEARVSRELAQARAEEVRRQAYAADMRLTSRAWETAHMNRGRQLLARYEPRADESDLRGFEWWYLWRLFHQRSTVIAEHAGGANAVAVSPAGRWIATGGNDGRVLLLNATGQLVRDLTAEDKIQVNHVAISNDGHLLAAAYEDGAVRLWRTATGEEIGAPMRHAGWVATAAFSPDGTILATGGEDHVVRLWETTDGRPAGELSGHTDTVRALAFHQQQGVLVSAAEDGTVRVWDVAGRRPDPRLPAGMLANRTQSWIRTLTFEDTGEALCGGAPNDEVVIWDFRDGKLGQPRRQFTEAVEPRRLVALPESRLAVGRSDSQIRLTWFGDAADESEFFLRGHEERIEALAAGPGRNELLSASRDGTVRRWAIDQSLGGITLNHNRGVYALLRWRGPWLAAIWGDGPIHVLEMPQGRLLRQFPWNPVSVGRNRSQGQVVASCALERADDDQSREGIARHHADG
jgi:WD40 repeat protein